MTDNSEFLHNLQRTNLWIGGLVLLAGFVVLGPGFSWVSLLIGLVVGAANIRVLVWVGNRLMSAGEKARAAYMFLIVTKLLLLSLLCFVLIALLNVEGIPFLVGMTTVPLALTWQSYRSLCLDDTETLGFKPDNKGS